MHSAAVHGTRRRGLAPLGHCELPLPLASRAKRARPEAAEVHSAQAMSGEPPVKHSSAVHGTRRRGLAPLGRCQLPLPRASRAKRAGPEAAEVDSGQAMSGITQKCTAQGGEVWHLLAAVNFRCLGPRERSGQKVVA
ncbi:hypothetical protein TYRP_021918 [Tyrophagus putrescentiae]|nr:hypothetical protein TYRP_021918 [Tyrophagus putrescentiae]